MPVVAYITNQFPSAAEPYIVDEIQELRRRGVVIVPCSVRPRAVDRDGDGKAKFLTAETLRLLPLRAVPALWASWLCLRRFALLSDFLRQALGEPRNSFGRWMRAVAHTWLGAYYAVKLERRSVQHIHAHHGFFSSWIAMVAARLLGISFSMTLHGSDLLLHRVYLDTKLRNCKFCLTISEFNRQYILAHSPGIDPGKVIVQHLGVDPPRRRHWKHSSIISPVSDPAGARESMIMLTAGRLHPVKDHEFLIRACAFLAARDFPFRCLIAGDGPERTKLQHLIQDLGLADSVSLLGHLSAEELNACYERCDLFVLTSRSEGIPVVLMEAMMLGKIVLAPAITGIPELVMNGETGFLYCPGSLEDFVVRVEVVQKLQSSLDPVRRAARNHVLKHFNRSKNLTSFGDLFLSHISKGMEQPHEDPLLQQI